MSIIRRVYQYGIAFVSLIMLAIGLSGLGRVLVDVVTPVPGSAGRAVISGVRSDVTENAALVIVGLPVWLLHWAMAGRTIRQDPQERAAALRRLYVYAVLLVMALRWAFSAQDFLEVGFGFLLPAADATTPRQLLAPLPWLVVAAALWLYHRRVAIVDRRRAGEQGAAATLRRWYTYGLAFIGLAVLLNGASGLLRLTWETVVASLSGTTVRTGGGAMAGAAA
ncbi:MAG: DUF5671 domain-containing protein, partial [Chloroflexota bacterium]